MWKKIIALGFVAAGTLSFLGSAASAQATRTWVSGVGDDVNPCSRTAPCKTFAGAISKTAVNGIIDCLDNGAFGAVTITKSMTIDCSENLAGILAGGTTGVIINIAAGDPLKTVHLRNLQIDGSGAGTRSGIRGVNILSAAAVYIEDTVIQNFINEGVLSNSSTNVDVFIRNSVIADNGGAGVSATSVASITARIQLDDVYLNRNGIGALVTKPTTGAIFLNVVNTDVQGNTGAGLQADGTNAIITLVGSIVSRNGTGLTSLNSGKFSSTENNLLRGNGGVNATPTVLPLE